VLEFKMEPDDAINKPKFHHQWLPDLVSVEKDFSKPVRKQLEAMGYTLKDKSPWSRTEIIQILNPTSTQRKIVAVGDKRGDDDARGY
jgi:gamma-glutamyltranspeptidase / glutathione hydrolase